MNQEHALDFDRNTAHPRDLQKFLKENNIKHGPFLNLSGNKYRVHFKNAENKMYAFLIYATPNTE